ncbi:CbtA family protein [Kiloniella laminariae]|uniref:CbtA family protein n=1 Tax=Kiloniella laminariae TaxID=454162 RepID=A0ABT4LFJ3_9PROT|nr:CbtA family protein [Kiloniella laminariae]MCZ4279876.1 CbtA family protein [Kiloniella laminariae]
MLRRIMTTAIAAGVAAGLLLSVIHEFTTTPIILHAEEYENAAPDHHAALPDPILRELMENALHKAAFFPKNLNDPSRSLSRNQSDTLYDDRSGQFHLVGGTHEGGHGEEEAWGPADGWERTLFTTLANVLTGVGFAAILVACFVFSNTELSGRRGVIWGLAGFAAFTLAPALGLPPEVPGSMAAELEGRQLWWIGAVVATAAGLWLMVFNDKRLLHVAGLLLLLIPHLIGAPQPAELGGNAPPELAGHFAAASIVVSALFWVILGWTSGTLWQRLATTEA